MIQSDHIPDIFIKEARSLYLSAQRSHDWEHIERVYRLTVRIAPLEKADLEIVGIAALLHDVKRPQEDSSQGTICHAEQGALFALSFLKHRGMAQQKAERIAECIRSHRYRSKYLPTTTEAKVLFDADKLDSLGAVGIARAFHFAGQINARVHSPLVDIDTSEPYGKNDTAYREFLVKLTHIRKRLYTQEAQRLATERHHFMVNFFSQLNEEVEGCR